MKVNDKTNVKKTFYTNPSYTSETLKVSPLALFGSGKPKINFVRYTKT